MDIVVVGVLPVRSFVIRLRPRCHSRSEAHSPLPCRKCADRSQSFQTASVISYLNDSPSLLRLNHLGTSRGTARPRADAKDLPGLVTTFTLMVTLLGGPTSTSSLYVQASRPGIVSTRQDVRFLGHETRSVPVSMSNDSSRFGTVSIRIHFQALSRLSWLSFSPPVFSTGRRDRFCPGCIRCRMQAPHGSQVERADLAAVPLDGICLSNSPLDNLTRFGRNGLPRRIARILRGALKRKVFLRRPTSATPPPWDRTHGLVLPTWEGITRKSLPRTGRATLMASSSTGEQHRK